MIRPIVPASVYRRLVEVDKEVFRQLERIPMDRLLDSGVVEDILRARIADSAEFSRALELFDYALDVRGRLQYDSLTHAQRSDLAAILAQAVRHDAAGHGEGEPR